MNLSIAYAVVLQHNTICQMVSINAQQNDHHRLNGLLFRLVAQDGSYQNKLSEAHQ